MGKVSKRSLTANLRDTTPEPAQSGRLVSAHFAVKKNAGAGETDAGWTLEPHVCRHCFSRLVSKAGDVACPNCGASCSGPVESLCACGLKIRRDGAAATRWVDVGLRCQPNPSPTPDFPSLFVAAPPSP